MAGLPGWDPPEGVPEWVLWVMVALIWAFLALVMCNPEIGIGE